MAEKFSRKVRTQLRRFVLRRLPQCRELTEVMSESLERRLGWRKNTILRLHNWLCPPCMRYLRQLLFMRKTLHRSPSSLIAQNSTQTLSPEARERIKQRLKDSPPS